MQTIISTIIFLVVYVIVYAIGYTIGTILAIAIVEKTNPIKIVKILLEK